MIYGPEYNKCDRQKLRSRINYYKSISVILLLLSILLFISLKYLDNKCKKLQSENTELNKQSDLIKLYNGIDDNLTEKEKTDYIKQTEMKLEKYNLKLYRIKDEYKNYFILPVDNPELCYTASSESEFGYRKYAIYGDHIHRGSFDCKTVNSGDVLCAADGTVYKTGSNDDCGNFIVIYHTFAGREYLTVYEHLSEIKVLKGMKIKQGDKIGIVGMTGKHQTGIILHFELSEKIKGRWYSVNMFSNSLHGVWDDRKVLTYSFIWE